MDGYPACEEDDCYCRRHFPNRSGGDELKVVNNEEDGEYTIRCETAIDNNDDIRKHCYFCEKWMIGSAMTIGKEKWCLRCVLDLWSPDLSDYFKDAFEKNPCLVFEIIPNHLAKDGRTTMFCEKCQKEHPIPDFENDEIKLDLDKKDEVSLEFDSEGITYLNKALHMKKYEKLLEFMDGFHDFKAEKVAARKLLKTSKIETRVNKAKRVIRTYLPNSTDEECDKILPHKYTKRDFKCTEKLLTDHDVVKFVQWMRETLD